MGCPVVLLVILSTEHVHRMGLLLGVLVGLTMERLEAHGAARGPSYGTCTPGGSLFTWYSAWYLP